MEESLKEALRKVKKLASDANPKLQKEKRPRVLQYYCNITGKRTYPYAGQKKKARNVKDLGKKDTHGGSYFLFLLLNWIKCLVFNQPGFSTFVTEQIVPHTDFNSIIFTIV